MQDHYRRQCDFLLYKGKHRTRKMPDNSRQSRLKNSKSGYYSSELNSIQTCGCCYGSANHKTAAQGSLSLLVTTVSFHEYPLTTLSASNAMIFSFQTQKSS